LADDFTQSLVPLRDVFEKENRYTPNLAALWRDQSGDQIGHEDSARLLQAIEHVAKWARQVGQRNNAPSSRLWHNNRAPSISWPCL